MNKKTFIRTIIPWKPYNNDCENRICYSLAGKFIEFTNTFDFFFVKISFWKEILRMRDCNEFVRTFYILRNKLELN